MTHQSSLSLPPASGPSWVDSVTSLSGSLALYIRYAQQVLREYDIPLPGDGHLEPIVSAALDARELYFAAAIEEPSGLDLAVFLEGFVLACFGVPSRFSDPHC